MLFSVALPQPRKMHKDHKRSASASPLWADNIKRNDLRRAPPTLLVRPWT